MSDLSNRLKNLTAEQRAQLARRLGGAEKADTTPARKPLPAIAIIGIGCRFPAGINSPESLWQALCDGVDAVTEVPAERWEAERFFDPDPMAAGRMNTRWGGFVAELDTFDPAFFGISPREAAAMDPQQRMFLECAWEAMENAGLTARSLAGSQTGVFVGAHNLSSDYYRRQSAQMAEIDAYTSTGTANSIVANRWSYLMDLRGPSLVLDTACSSSLVALHLAVQSLRAGECELAFAGGVNVLDPRSTMAFSKLQMMASDGRCKTFDARADGFVRAEGCGVLVLKPADQAVADGDPIVALIRGSAVNQDGHTNGLTAPNGLSQQRVVQRALHNAGVQAADVGYVETHGTGTSLGDPIEVEALQQVLDVGDAPDCLLGAIKSNLGHTETAAGVAGVIKAALVVKHGYVPANLHFQSPNPHLRLAGSRLKLATQGTEWSAPHRVAGVSSFGFGGTNAHMVLAQPPARNHPPADGVPKLLHLTLSAREPQALPTLAGRYVELLRPCSDEQAAEVCAAAATQRDQHQYRCTVAGASLARLVDGLKAVSTGGSPANSVSGEAVAGHAPPLVFVCSGQGNQYPGLASELLHADAEFGRYFGQASELINQQLQWSPLAALEAGQSDYVADTRLAQPMVFAVQVALGMRLADLGVKPDYLIGHSVGEVAAACLAGALTLEQAVTVVCHRAQATARASGTGHLMAVALEPEKARALIEQLDIELWLAAVNGPAMITVAGTAPALQTLKARLDTDQVFCRQLAGTCAFHSPLMEPMAQALAQTLRQPLSGLPAGAAHTPMYSTARGMLLAGEVLNADYWADNVRQPVSFQSGVEYLLSQRAATFIELGPHPSLVGAIEQTAAAAEHHGVVAFGSLVKGQKDIESLGLALARLQLRGNDVDLPWLSSQPATHWPLPNYPWQRQRHWIEDRRRSEPTDPDRPDQWALELAWQTIRSGGPVELASLAPAGPLTPQALNRLAKDCGLDDSTVRQLLDQAGDAYVDAALSALGDAYTEANLARPWYSLALQRARSQRIDNPALVDPDQLLDQALDLAPDYRDVIELFRACGSALDQILTGAVDPLSLLFPPEGGSAASIYSTAPFARVGNAMFAGVIRQLLSGVPGARILEVGAGTGGGTGPVLEALAEAPPGEYVFSDLSPGFLTGARDRFRRHDFMRFETLNLEQNPLQQGFAGGSFDLITAVNVVHATENLGQVIGHLKDLLAPGGALVMLEGADHARWIDLTFGLTEGWWRFDGKDADRQGYPLLDADQWQALLAREGFSSVDVIPAHPQGMPGLFQQNVVVARKPQPESIQNPQLDAGQPLRHGERWLLGPDTGGLMAQLAAALIAEGAEVEMAQDHQRLATLAANQWAGMVYAGALDHNVDQVSVADWDAGAEPAVLSALELCAAIQQPPATLVLVTRAAVATGADDRVRGLAGAPLWGLGKVLSQELTATRVKLVDLDEGTDSDTSAQQILKVISRQDDEDQFAFRGDQAGQREWVPRLVPASSTASDPVTFEADGSYLISGGLGGVGLALAAYLGARGARHLTLISRRPFPAPVQWAEVNESDSAWAAVSVLQSLVTRGVAVDVVSASVCDEAAMSELIATFGQSRPPLRGIFHSAMVNHNRLLSAETGENYRAISEAKTRGGWLLHQLTRRMDLHCFVLFSSGASVWGPRKQGAYAAANAGLDALAHYRRGAGLPALAVNWGWVEGGSTTEGDHRYFATMGLQSMPVEKALDEMTRALSAGATQRVIANVRWDRLASVYRGRFSRPLLDLLVDHGDPVNSPTAMPPSGNDDWRRQSPERARTHVAAVVHNAVAAALNLVGGQLAPERGFFDLGMDSITSMEVRNQLQQQLGCDLPATAVLEYPTLSKLTAFLNDEILALPRPAGAAPTDPAAEVDEMDEAELTALLDQEISTTLGGETGSSNGTKPGGDA